ncbi:hypothetical protein D3C78_1244610 [compost metagenome]
MLAGPQLPAQHQAVIAGHHDVQHDQVHRGGFQEGAHLPAIGNDSGAQAVLLQVVANQFSDLAIVIHYQHVIDMIHGVQLLGVSL